MQQASGKELHDLIEDVKEHQGKEAAEIKQVNQSPTASGSSEIKIIKVKKSRGHKRYAYLTLTYGAVLLELLFAYFMYRLLESITQKISDEYEVDNSNFITGIYSIIISLVILNLAGDVTSVVPAEEYYELYLLHKDKNKEKGNKNDKSIEISASQKGFKNFLINYPFRIFTYCNSYPSFIVGALTDAVAVAELIPSKIVQWPVSIVITGFGTMYYHMLSHDDLVEHNRFIWLHILDHKSSIIINIIKSPLKSFEVALQIGGNTLYRAAILGYVVQQFLHYNFGQIGKLGIMLIAVTMESTAYATLFTRLKGSYNKFFDPGFNTLLPRDKEDIKIPKGNLLLNTLLSFVKSTGICYFAYKCIPLSGWPSIAVTSSLGLILLTRDVYFNYKQSLNEAALTNKKKLEVNIQEIHSQQSNKNKMELIASVVNFGGRATRIIGFLGALNSLNEELHLYNISSGLDFTDLIVLTGTVGIPIATNEFFYFQKKLVENFNYYQEKISAEKNVPHFGIPGSFFRSRKEYPDGYFERYQKIKNSNKNKGEEAPLLGYKHK